MSSDLQRPTLSYYNLIDTGGVLEPQTFRGLDEAKRRARVRAYILYLQKLCGRAGCRMTRLWL